MLVTSTKQPHENAAEKHRALCSSGLPPLDKLDHPLMRKLRKLADRTGSTVEDLFRKASWSSWPSAKPRRNLRQRLSSYRCDPPSVPSTGSNKCTPTRLDRAKIIATLISSPTPCHSVGNWCGIERRFVSTARKSRSKPTLIDPHKGINANR